ncbi:MAG: hypothetical protein JXB49_23295 [Bacteroidales bacterium]|nr:hypothetical protein [Bacteroidales bacterium]
MKKLPHGLISLTLAFLSISGGFYAIFIVNNLLAILYSIIMLLGFMVIIYSYCTKCPGRFTCGHIILGKLAALFPKRDEEAYSKWDYLGVIISFLLIIAIPQFYLWKIKWLFISFWTLLILAVMEINKHVCTKCLNNNCALCKNKHFQNHNLNNRKR